MRDKFFTNSERVRVYAQGKLAFEEDKLRCDNPYTASKDLAGLWWHGWDKAEGKCKGERAPFEKCPIVHTKRQDDIKDKRITRSLKETVYAQGKLAFAEHERRAYNPYASSNLALAVSWWHGWDTAAEESLEQTPPSGRL